MADDNEETRNTGLKVILYVFFISAFLTIIVFMLGQGLFNVFIEQLNWSYETLEMVRRILVKSEKAILKILALPEMIMLYYDN
jgi:hypothetical protein